MIPKVNYQQFGWIELITGCMFAGKTEEFIKRLKRHHFAKRQIVVFKTIIDNRYSDEEIFSHSGMSIKAHVVQTSDDVKRVIEEYQQKSIEIDVVGIDEVQFFDKGLVSICQNLADQGMIVITTGLDKDYRNEPFQNVDELLIYAEKVDKLQAVCRVCGQDANRTQRIVNGKPAKKDEPLIIVSGEEQYEARCRFHYQKPM
ncbi:thymidine kinase [Spiroplasma endosymbiont of Labia minor]|uniref:thymidine kinase n=1 Tax=Spiroplasma endosymbiont of Labia minor TaxID=3066305 RepID=UPI0030D59E1F